MTEEKTLIPTDSWVDDSSLRSVAERGTIDAYCNLATLVFAKITNLIAERRKGSGRAAELRSRINALWCELQDWRDYRPRRAIPLLRTEPPQKSPFQVILFTHSSSSKSVCRTISAVLTYVISLRQYVLPCGVDPAVTSRARTAE
jgi:hypothetical protein